jgi:hypothetical protein
MGVPLIAPDSPLEATNIVDKAYMESVATLSTTIRTIVTITQSAYDALGVKDANTLYVII